MRISALVVTKNRPHFRDWWTWNILKQSRLPDEIIVVESSDLDDDEVIQASADIQERLKPYVKFVNIVFMPPTTVTGEARQAALEEAEGDVITWWDDDDWYHPDQIREIERGFQQGCLSVVVFPSPWHLRLSDMRLIRVDSIREVTLIAACGIHGDLAQRFEFDPERTTGEDVGWLQDIFNFLRTSRRKPLHIDKWDMPTITMLHGRNTFGMEGYRTHIDKNAVSLDFEAFDHPDVDEVEWAELRRRVLRLRESQDV